MCIMVSVSEMGSLKKRNIYVLNLDELLWEMPIRIIEI